MTFAVRLSRCRHLEVSLEQICVTTNADNTRMREQLRDTRVRS